MIKIEAAATQGEKCPTTHLVFMAFTTASLHWLIVDATKCHIVNNRATILKLNKTEIPYQS
jgi:hypothetical protein